MTDLEAAARRIVELGAQVPMKTWRLEPLNDDARKWGAFVYAPHWGAICVCPRESPQFSARATNMAYIAAAGPEFAPAIAADWLRLREENARLREALRPFNSALGEDEEDFPDDHRCVLKLGRSTDYTLTLADFRRARAALDQHRKETT